MGRAISAVLWLLRSTALAQLASDEVPRDRTKEIARRLQMGERPVKFHVSNLLGKRVKRRADLILLSVAEKRRA